MENFESFETRPQTPTLPNGSSTPPVSLSQVRRPIGKIALALAKAQGEFLPVLKTRTVDFINNKGQRVNYTYADLADLIASTAPALSKYEIGTTHVFEPRNGMFGMKTSLIHSSDEQISTWYPMPDPMSMKNQEFGAEITYARRYSLSMLLGIASEEDDDGHGHVKHETPAQAKTQPSGGAKAITPQGQPVVPKPDAHLPPSEAQLARLYTIVDEKGWSKDQAKEYLNFRFKKLSTKELTRGEYDEFVDAVVTKNFNQAMAGVTKAAFAKN